MKTRILLLAILAASLICANAQSQTRNNWGYKPPVSPAQYASGTYNAFNNPTLRIQSSENFLIQVWIDGTTISDIGNIVDITFGEPGYHQIIINQIASYQGYNGWYQQATPIYNSNIYIPPASHQLALINLNGILSFQNNDQPTYNNTWPTGNHPPCGQYGGQQYQSFMSDANFTQLKKTISASYFDDTRRDIAIQAIQTNHLSAAQVLEVTKLFSFESNRLAFAKAAYLVSQDRANFFLVNNAFRFSSSIDELNQYISAHS